MRWSLTQLGRIPAAEPSTFLILMKVFFLQESGLHRQLACPLYGLTRKIIEDSCHAEASILKALDVLLSCGRFLFSVLSAEVYPVEAIRSELLSQITEVRDGRGSEFISTLLRWVRTVQIRALQDFAAEQAEEFDQVWETLQYSGWSEVAGPWTKKLRTREERDLGWVASLEAPSCSTEVALFREGIQRTVRDIATTTALEDRHRWDACVRSQTPPTLTPLHTDCIGTLQETAVIHCLGTRTDGAHGLERGRADECRDTDTVPPKSSDTGVPGEREGSDPYGYVSPLRSRQSRGYDTGEVEDGPGQCLFPEILRVSPTRNTCATVAKVVRSADGVDDMRPEALDSEVRVSQFLTPPTSLRGKTTGRGRAVMFPKPLEGGARECAADSVLQNLNPGFGLDRDIDVDGSKHAVDKEVQPDCVTNAAFDGTSPLWRVLDASPPVVSPLSEAYVELGIEKLLKAVPSKGIGTITKPVTVLYNQYEKEIEVKDKDIRDLKYPDTRLGNDIMDFVLSRVYLSYAECHRRKVHIVSSYVVGGVTAFTRSGCGLEKLARDFLQPPPGVQVEQVEDLILPWVSDGHWSVLVFQRNRIMHLDSFKGQLHHPRGEHIGFVRVVCAAWQHLLGVEGYSVQDVESVDVFQQAGKDECGQLTIRNIMLYMKVSELPFELH